MNRTLISLVVFVFVTATIALAGNSAPGNNTSTQQLDLMGSSADESGQIIPGQYIVVLKSSKTMGGKRRSPAMAATAKTKVKGIAKAIGVEPEQVYGAAIEGFSCTLTDAQVLQLKNDPAIDFIEPDRTVTLLAQTTPWGIDRVKAPLAQANGNNGSGVKVGVIDTGIDYLHPDLAALYAGGYDFYMNDADPMDQQGHGTHVSGTIAGIDNTFGVIGVSPAVSLYGIKVFGSSGNTQWSIVVAGIDWAAANGMDVVNMSLGGVGGSLALETACNNAYASGMLLVAAAGNSGGPVLFPAKYTSVIAVSASDQNNNRAYFSCWGPEIELTAPGVNVLSTWRNNRYVQLFGTSMAAPHVTGVAALIIGTGNYATAIDVRNRLTSTSVDLGLPGRDNFFGFGLPDAEAATGLTPDAPVANFTATPVTGCTPMDVSFTDQTWGMPTSWLWDFGDGTTSTLQNPSHTYTINGNYDITLTATNATGSDQMVKLNYITVGGPQCSPPVADFGAIPETGCAPFQTQFWDISSGGPTSWFWDFGDGTSSILQHPIHTYTVGGAYSVSLTVANPSGSNTVTKVDYIVVDPIPVVDFSATPTTGFPPLTVNFTDLTANNPTWWFWDFGDFGSSTLQNPTVLFNKPGEYKVILTAGNACGTATLIREAYIMVNEGGGCNTPVASFSGTPTTGTAPLTVNFNDQSSNNPSTWSWDFGDQGTSNQQNPSHTYNSAGTYTVTLTAGNNCGQNTIIQTNYITVTDPGCVSPPVSAFIGIPSTGNAPLSVNFTDQSTNTPDSWNWDFGDGGTATTQNPNHTYTTAGTYSVTLTATNACGSNQLVQANYITVTDPGCSTPPTASFVGSPTTGNAPLTVSFTDQSTNTPDSWNWDFGDGGTATTQHPNHTYTTAGIYSVTLTATNACGSNQVVQANYITVTDPGCSTPPTASFVGSPTSGNAPLTVSFTDQSTNTPDSWNWDFGDGGTATTQNPNHTYTTAGTYTVTLTATNACGSNQVVQANYITVSNGGCTNPPVADFIGNPLSGYAPLTVNFTDLSSNNPTSWSWKFGDFGNSTMQNPTVIYNKPGRFKVILTSSNACGSNTMLKEEYIDILEGGGGKGLSIGDPLPDVFELGQNYPNPFNPTTGISFNLPEGAFVSLEVYNIKGQKVATLINRTMSTGLHTIEWNASKYPSGIYLYRLSAGAFSETKKMLLLK